MNHRYRTHNCNALTDKEAGKNVKLSGWVSRKRNHGGLLFVDLRDMFGITQCVIEEDASLFATYRCAFIGKRGLD